MGRVLATCTPNFKAPYNEKHPYGWLMWCLKIEHVAGSDSQLTVNPGVQRVPGSGMALGLTDNQLN